MIKQKMHSFPALNCVSHCRVRKKAVADEELYCGSWAYVPLKVVGGTEQETRTTVHNGVGRKKFSIPIRQELFVELAA